jgi:hypothetical protein
VGAGKNIFFDQDGPMSQKRRFTPEPVTKPATRRRKAGAVRSSSPVPKNQRERAEAPTLPPPRLAKEELRARESDERITARQSEMRSRRSARTTAAATVDEVVADLSKDPRRERDDDD